jgi:hypothetical protein
MHYLAGAGETSYLLVQVRREAHLGGNILRSFEEGDREWVGCVVRM